MKKEKSMFYSLERKLIMAGIILLSTISASAQEADSTKQLKAVMVTATRTETKVIMLPRDVSVITREELNQSQYQNLGELLNANAGIYTVGANQNAGANQSVFMRGTNSNNTLILIDGVRMSDPSGVNNGIDLSEISLSNIEQIEIVRGAHSTMYGTGAIGGVINIITRKATKDKLSGDIGVNGGVFSNGGFTTQQNLNLNFKPNSKIYFSGNIFNQITNGFDVTKDTISSNDTSITKKFDEDNFKKLDLNFKVGYDSKKTKGFIHYRNSSQDADLDKVYEGTSKYYNPWGGFPTTYYDGNYTLNYKRNLLNYNLSHQLNENSKITLNGGFTIMTRTVLDDSTEVEPGQYDKSFFKGIYEGKVLTNDLQYDFISKYVNVTAGINQYNETMNINTWNTYYFFGYTNTTSSYDSLNPESSIYAGYLQTRVNGSILNNNLEKLNVLFGVRFNNTSLSGNALTYSIAPSIQLDNTASIYASISTGFNAPSLYQMYAPEENFTSGITRGNKNLEAENSTSMELGIKKIMNNNLFFSASIYSNTIKNVIEYVYLWDKSIGIDTLGNDWMRNDFRGDTYFNAGTLTSYGMDFSIEGKISEKFKVNSFVSLVFGKLDFDEVNSGIGDSLHLQLYSTGQFLNKARESNNLIRRPSTASFALTYLPSKALQFVFTTRFVDSRADIYYDGFNGPYGALNARTIEPYALFDFMINVNLKDKLNLNVRLENLLDSDYVEIMGYNSRGRSAYLSLRYTF